jgi:monofunctional biosynthetic peptidoglycan transglycosylase
VVRALLALAALALVMGVGYEAWVWPDVAGLARHNPRTTAFIERARSLARQEGGSRVLGIQWVDYQRISPHLKRAVVVAEDINFFSHAGFAVNEMKNALEDAIQDLEMPRGASTLTQQLAKNLWLSPARTPLRKVKEAILTWQLERHLDKRRILELYLNVAEFGPRIFGAEAAARHFFGKHAATLTPHEAAELAAGLPRPASWHPGSRSHTYRRRVARIEALMARADWLWNLI